METESESENESDLDLPTRVTEKLKDWNPNERSEKKRGIYDRIKPVIYFPFQFWKATLLNLHDVSHQESFRMSFLFRPHFFIFKICQRHGWKTKKSFFENIGDDYKTVLLRPHSWVVIRPLFFQKSQVGIYKTLLFLTHTLLTTHTFS